MSDSPSPQPLPCPFCGKEPRVDTLVSIAEVRCCNPDCEVKSYVWGDPATREEIIAKWNRRESRESHRVSPTSDDQKSGSEEDKRDAERLAELERRHADALTVLRDPELLGFAKLTIIALMEKALVSPEAASPSPAPTPEKIS